MKLWWESSQCVEYTDLIFYKGGSVMRLGTGEILLILAVALVIFGGGKLAGIGKALGTSIREFKNEVKRADAGSEDVVQAETYDKE
jgi:sec-independent protein translocase protein TatA